MLLHPIVWLNSATWGQCDSIYVFWIVLTLYLLYKEKYRAAYAVYGVAFMFKLQAIFVLPVLLVHYMINRRRYSIFNFVYTIAVFYFSSIHVVILRRDLFLPFRCYIAQTGTYSSLFLNYPSFWTLLGDHYHLFSTAAGFLSIALIGMLAFWIIKKAPGIFNCDLFLVSVAFLTICVFFMPAMHERYDYCILVMLCILCCISRKFVFPLLVITLTSLNTYSKYLFGSSYEPALPILAVLYGAMLIYIVKLLLEQQPHSIEDNCRC